MDETPDRRRADGAAPGHTQDTEPVRPGDTEQRTQTAPTGHTAPGDGAAEDVQSDPALDDRLGSDWTDEGGAAPAGPATASA